jgi:hypothetical protein
MKRNYQRMRETLFDLYTERDALPWYLRTIALIASWLALGGYVVFALIFTSDTDNVKVSRTFLIILGSAFLVVGYGAIAIVAYLGRSLLFLFDAVLVPILTSSFMGIFVTVMNHALHKRFPIPTQIYIYVPLVTACVTTVWTGRKGNTCSDGKEVPTALMEMPPRPPSYYQRLRGMPTTYPRMRHNGGSFCDYCLTERQSRRPRGTTATRRPLSISICLAKTEVRRDMKACKSSITVHVLAVAVCQRIPANGAS